ncbi:biotin/lipoyl-containing protein [Marispirochaeta sp.]|jgi:pyruvate carboxylase subunit B|uniref:biotin/lipoyl-containing protein n=1 Tax=Marispirochaeta sp. TaxID=2038653 RepID=UPI0029C887E2|nr:biotin/lipoyl-containing protein [Marispirochaeta sp.]
MKKRVDFMVTAFRDGFQSAFGARVFTKDFLPAVEAAVEAGINHFEAGGGARFQSLFFYCNENAFDMMDSFREAAGPDVNLQTLARGVNVVGLDSQSSDVIDLHARMFRKHGITTIRNFDALNDVNNLIYSGQCIVDAGLKHEVVVTMMELPPGCEGSHTPEFYTRSLKDILDAGIPFDSVCFKDASGTSVPSKVHETIKQARQLLGDDVQLVFHSHETAGIGVAQYMAALEAGANQIDLSLAPCSGGTCQTDVMTMWHALRGTDFDLGVDIGKIEKAEEVFKECMKDYFMPPEATKVEPLIPFSPMPGGALTANTQMLRDNNMMDKYVEISANMGEVVRRGGFGTSVTPVSQFYFQQAFNNTLIGPWEKIAEGYGKMVLGYFGKTPIPADPEIIKLAAEQLGLEPTDKKVLEINDADPKKGVAAAKKMLHEAGIEETEENIFIAATCKEKGITYLKGEAKSGVRKIDRSKPAEGGEAAAGGYTVKLEGKTFKVKLEGDKAIVNGKSYSVDVTPGIDEGGAAASSGDGESIKVSAPLPGIILRLSKEEGDTVSEGEVIMVMESMKMENEIHSPSSGVIANIPVKQGDQVAAGDTLVEIQ